MEYRRHVIPEEVWRQKGLEFCMVVKLPSEYAIHGKISEPAISVLINTRFHQIHDE